MCCFHVFFLNHEDLLPGNTGDLILMTSFPLNPLMFCFLCLQHFTGMPVKPWRRIYNGTTVPSKPCGCGGGMAILGFALKYWSSLEEVRMLAARRLLSVCLDVQAGWQGQISQLMNYSEMDQPADGLFRPLSLSISLLPCQAPVYSTPTWLLSRVQKEAGREDVVVK